MRNIIGNLFLVLLGAVLGLLLAEATLRIISFNRPIIMVADPNLGGVHRPSLSFRYTDEGDAIVSTNSFGHRDREHNLKKPEGVFRIAVLGDSYAQAYQVNQNEAFWAVLENSLNQCDAFGKKVEVLNFGVSGYGTAQELLMLRHKAWNFDPDFVLLAFLTGNDVRNNSKTLEPEKIRPFFSLNGEGKLVLDDSFRSDPQFVRASSWLFSTLRLSLDSSRLLQFISFTKYRLHNLVHATHESGNENYQSVANEAGLDDAVYLEDAGADWKAAWDITEALLIQMNKDILDRKRNFLVVVLSNAIQVDPQAERTNAFIQQRGILNEFTPDYRLRGFGLKHGFDVLVLAPSLQKMARERKIYLHGFGDNLGRGHWNQNGHRAAGEIIAACLCNANVPFR